jgi:hypothetical protein
VATFDITTQTLRIYEDTHLGRHYGNYSSKDEDLLPSPMSLLLVCKQIYAELQPVIKELDQASLYMRFHVLASEAVRQSLPAYTINSLCIMTNTALLRLKPFNMDSLPQCKAARAVRKVVLPALFLFTCTFAASMSTDLRIEKYFPRITTLVLYEQPSFRTFNALDDSMVYKESFTRRIGAMYHRSVLFGQQLSCLAAGERRRYDLIHQELLTKHTVRQSGVTLICTR